ncbi:hypothetical protein RvY_00562 [Ramazzottius varieornatus]|uniref:Uncharacterized protein n=1 Tax=Ramazzottius varieornatus TaxID=947166 RepID=A0A1D1UE49_RAMVA|nr:hypothetical protein RvY_00562 [Ramazzottius varieornatus]
MLSFAWKSSFELSSTRCTCRSSQLYGSIAKNMAKFGFTGFVHNGKEDDPESAAKVAALEREVGAVQRWEVRVHKATEDHLKGTKTERMMAKSDYNVQHHIHQDAPPPSQHDPKAGQAQDKRRQAKAETQTAKSKGVATDKDEKEAQTTEKVETADKQHQGKETKATPRPPFMIRTTKKQKERVVTVKKNKEKAKAKEWHPPPQKKIEGTPFWLRTKEEKRPKSAPATSASKAKTDPSAESQAVNPQRSNVDATAGEGNPGADAEAPTNPSQYQLTPAASRSDQKDGNSSRGQSSSTAKGATKPKGGSTESKRAGKKGASTEKSTSKKRKRPKAKKVPSTVPKSAVSVAPTTEQKTAGKHLLAGDEVPNTTREAMASDLTAFGKLSPPQTISDVGFDLPPDNPDQARSPPIPVDETQMRLEHEDAQYSPQSMRTSLHPEVTETLSISYWLAKPY